MPRMKSFDCPLFPLTTAQEINISDIKTLTEVTVEKLAVVKDELDEVNHILHDTHIGHEANLWGQDAHDEDYTPIED